MKHNETSTRARPLALSVSAGTPGVDLSAIIDRIERIVDEETAALRTDVGFDIKASNARKSRYLYELTRAMKSVDERHLQVEHRDGMKRLSRKLELNETAILAHLNAVSEVAALLQDAIQRSDTDGTYSAHEFRAVAGQ